MEAQYPHFVTWTCRSAPPHEDLAAPYESLRGVASHVASVYKDADLLPTETTEEARSAVAVVVVVVAGANVAAAPATHHGFTRSSSTVTRPASSTWSTHGRVARPLPSCALWSTSSKDRSYARYVDCQNYSTSSSRPPRYATPAQPSTPRPPKPLPRPQVDRPQIPGPPTPGPSHVAQAIGNDALFKAFGDGCDLIRRDIVFSSSLYVEG